MSTLESELQFVRQNIKSIGFNKRYICCRRKRMDLYIILRVRERRGQRERQRDRQTERDKWGNIFIERELITSLVVLLLCFRCSNCGRLLGKYKGWKGHAD